MYPSTIVYESDTIALRGIHVLSRLSARSTTVHARGVTVLLSSKHRVAVGKQTNESMEAQK